MDKRTIAAFDFDGTITTKDTLFDFISFYHGRSKFLWGLFRMSPTLVCFKLGFITNEKAKQRLFSYFFRGKDITEFNDFCRLYAKRIDDLCYQSSLNQLMVHNDRNDEIILISASIENWIVPWASAHSIKRVLATQIEIENGLITGRFSSKNCYGAEKVNRLKEIYPNKEEYTLYAYGDSRGDKELLDFADFSTLYESQSRRK
ncbi:MAG: HAD family hydrolase [Dysgonomonas sp.]